MSAEDRFFFINAHKVEPWAYVCLVFKKLLISFFFFFEKKAGLSLLMITILFVLLLFFVTSFTFLFVCFINFCEVVYSENCTGIF